MLTVFRYTFNFLAIVSLVAGVLAPSLNHSYSDEAGEVSGIVVGEQLPVVFETIPLLKTEAKPLESNAAAALTVDVRSGKILYQKNGDSLRPTASLAKLMTAVVVINLVPESTVVEVVPEDLVGLVQPVMGLVAGEQMTVADLLRGMLISSANDAAAVLSRSVGGSSERFAQLMNAMGQQLELQHTHFRNATGFDQPGQYATAEDWVSITRAVLKHPLLADIVQTKQARVASTDQKIRHWLKSTNQLLADGRIMGVKTGYTDEARGNLILLAADAQGNKIITVVLGSERREEDSRALIDWVFESFQF